MKFSVNNNRADQSAHMQNPEPTTEVEISQLNGKSCANNDGAVQPAHLRRHK